MYPGDSKAYNEYVTYHTLRAAVCGMLENDCCLNIPLPLKQEMETYFLANYDFYEKLAKKYLHLDGINIVVSFIDSFLLVNIIETIRIIIIEMMRIIIFEIIRIII